MPRARPTGRRRCCPRWGSTTGPGTIPRSSRGGEQQRIAIARALANEPPILLADEPTGNLDSANGRHIVELLHRVNRSRGTTIVLVTHDSDLASGTDVTLRMRDGRTERLAPAPVQEVLA